VSNRKLYKVVFYEKDMVERRDAGSEFNLTEYYSKPGEVSVVF